MKEGCSPFIKKYGSGSPCVAIVYCQHGDEVLGKKVVEHFDYHQLIKGTLLTVFANPLAYRKQVRFVEMDLNRSFPGKISGTHEEKIAQQLITKLKIADYVMDLHTTTSISPSFAIFTILNKKNLDLIKFSQIEKVVLMGN